MTVQAPPVPKPIAHTDARTILDTIGNTPLVPLTRMVKPGMATILLKLEYLNPSGSLKDRIVRYIIEEAEAAGALKPHHVIIDASSGNTGIALGMVARLKGYRARIYMPETKTVERRKTMRVFGTELVLTSGADQNSHIWSVEQAAKDSDTYFYLNQNGNAGNWKAHYHGTSAEILVQTGGRMDCFVAGAGTGGALMGMARYLRDHHLPGTVVSVEPAAPGSKIEGLLYFDGAYVPPIWDDSLIDEHSLVPDDDAFEKARELAALEGVFAGPSSGAAVATALRKARELGPGHVVVALIADRGDRYLSTRLIPE